MTDNVDVTRDHPHIPQAPIDPNLKVPKSVRDAAAKAESFYATPPAGDPPAASAPPAAGTPSEPPAPPAPPVPDAAASAPPVPAFIDAFPQDMNYSAPFAFVSAALVCATILSAQDSKESPASPIKLVERPAVFEVTTDRQIVWEWMNAPAAGARTPATVYRAYRIPYTWLAQLPRPQEKAVTPPANGEFRVP